MFSPTRRRDLASRGPAVQTTNSHVLGGVGTGVFPFLTATSSTGHTYNGTWAPSKLAVCLVAKLTCYIRRKCAGKCERRCFKIPRPNRMPLSRNSTLSLLVCMSVYLSLGMHVCLSVSRSSQLLSLGLCEHALACVR
ncbi:unnamed protein product [Protopolystoma xenopodis]|uniref:Uncharacterized protein n=1 Tax=Protopolystoma xenopodis TaxID=117903 RepID=A0A3S4ZUA4_9PLAT|nr:unnamed protein product [Protopolystoma xenopodis]